MRSPEGKLDTTDSLLNFPKRSVQLVHHVCCIAGSFDLLDDVRSDLKNRKIDLAVRRHDNAALFDWLLSSFSFQGISDRVAAAYMAKNGVAQWHQMQQQLEAGVTCPKLRSHWAFDKCEYDKGSGCCSEPEHISQCPLPSYRLRNGKLNQTAFSFFLFVRDVARGDLVSWIDNQIASARPSETHPAPVTALQEALIGPLRHVFGISDKLLTMTLASLMLGLPKDRPGWVPIGANMIAIDSLVHNFLHRTGLLRDADHPYGNRCYQEGGCAEIIQAISSQIDARQFNREFPRDFPRFIQNAIWRYCSIDGFNVCNGAMINDRLGCDNNHCSLHRICEHRPLKNTV